MSMSPQSQLELTATMLFAPLLVSTAFVALCSFVAEPARQRFSAIFLAGAGAAYLSGGFGLWEFGFCAVITLLAYRGLDDYRAIAIGWVLHTCWDIAHHLYGNPIIPFEASSSIGCAVCDLGLAAWYFAGAPTIWKIRFRTAA
jgi:hypothetical protein